MSPRFTVACVTGAILLAACGGDSTGEVTDSTLSPVTTMVAPVPDTSTVPPATMPADTTPDTTPEPGASEPPTTTAPVAPPATGGNGPGPGSSGCTTTPGDTVTVTLQNPMPGPDFCLEIRQSQSLRVINSTTDVAVLSIYQGSADNLFQTPALAPGESFESEAVGQAFSSGEWSLEVDTVVGWLGTLFVVSG